MKVHFSSDTLIVSFAEYLAAILNFGSRGRLQRGINYDSVGELEMEKMKGRGGDGKEKYLSSQHPILIHYPSTMTA